MPLFECTHCRKQEFVPLTSAGELPFKGIIHVAGINMLWRASERSIRDSVRNAVALALESTALHS